MVLGRSTGGIGTHVVGLVGQLRAAGERVDVVTDAVTAERFGMADAHRWWPGRASGPVGSLRRLWWLRALARQADVVHAHGHQAGLVSTLATLGLATPVVVSQHNAVLVSGPRRRLLDLLQRFVATRAALVTGASSDLVDRAWRHGARHARLAEVPSPRVPALLGHLPLDDGPRRTLAGALLGESGIQAPEDAAMVLTIARIAPQKDLGTVVEAAAALQVSFHLGEMPAVWVVVGGGDQPLREDLERRATALGAPVHFLGEQEDPDRWLRAADVFVLTSHWEARALVVQEAMAAGVPVVAREVGGLPDLLQGVGTLVPAAGPASSYAHAVARYLREPATRHTAVLAGRERAATWDDEEATARRWREWYSALLPMT